MPRSRIRWAAVIVGLVIVISAGAAILLSITHTIPETAARSRAAASHHVSPRHPARSVSSTTPSTAYASGSIGTTAWIAAMRHDLARTAHLSAVPPLWAAPWPNHPYGWVILDPLAQSGHLWYGLVTVHHPASPVWVPIPTQLTQVTTAQLDALPWPMKQALSLVYDVQHGLPYPIAVASNMLTSAGPGQIPWDTLETDPPSNPAGWSLQWQPAYPGVPETLTVNVVMPWTMQGQTAWLAIQAGLTAHTTLMIDPSGYVINASSLAQAVEPATPAQGLVASARP